jgi:hypothetical protein
MRPQKAWYFINHSIIYMNNEKISCLFESVFLGTIQRKDDITNRL